MFSPTPMKGRGVFLVVLDVIFKLVDFFLRYLFECTGELVPILKIEKQIILFVLKFFDFLFLLIGDMFFITMQR